VSLHAFGALVWNISSPHGLFTLFAIVLTGPLLSVINTDIYTVITCEYA
jgi:hypothetical protein